MKRNPTNVKVILDICCLLAPGQREVDAFDAMHADMTADKIRDREILIQLLSTLLDGLRYENWPNREPA
jgi:hypothetical protein